MTDRQKILIVDDKEANLYALEKVLENVDAQIIRATSGNDAFIACLHHEFALGILDVQMPGMDGYELAEHLRADENTLQLPIIFLTAVYSDEHHVFKGYRAGAVDFVTKPYRPEILLAKVRIFLQLIKTRKALQASEEKYRTLYETSRDGIALSDLNGTLMDANQLFLDMMGYTFLELKGLNIHQNNP